MSTPTPAPLYTPAHMFPVSVKGVTVQAGKVLLLENERNEWELPGGKLELGEHPPDIVTYGCHVLTTKPPVVSNEHKQAALFTPEEVPDLTMPDGYKQSIAAWLAHLNAATVNADAPAPTESP